MNQTVHRVSASSQWKIVIKFKWFKNWYLFSSGLTRWKLECLKRNANQCICNAGTPVGIDIFFVKQKESGFRRSRDHILGITDLLILINILFI